MLLCVVRIALLAATSGYATEENYKNLRAVMLSWTMSEVMLAG